MWFGSTMSSPPLDSRKWIEDVSDGVARSVSAHLESRSSCGRTGDRLWTGTGVTRALAVIEGDGKRRSVGTLQREGKYSAFFVPVTMIQAEIQTTDFSFRIQDQSHPFR
jgi:hypothetical protein